MQLEVDGVRRAIAFPMASAAPEAKSDHPASDMGVTKRGLRGVALVS
jgi:hypothetical protein